ncbi:MAG: hypothetical protein LIO71_00160 [Ruminococcus sp.]|nr:hypothetical protein [Ruminococcus sp.]MCD7800205.1 hypothetical protein [Ruminococcus sp.]
MELKKDVTNDSNKCDNLKTVNVKKGKFDLTFDINKISDKERFNLESNSEEISNVEEPKCDTNDNVTSTKTSTNTTKKVKKVKSVMQGLNVILFAGAFVCIVGGMILLERPTVSESENRNLAKFPTFSVDALLDGSYAEDITTWFDDTVPFRDVFKDISAKFRSILGIDYGGMIVVNVSGNGVANEDNSVTDVTTTSSITTNVTTSVTIGISEPIETTVVTTTEVSETTSTSDDLIEMEENLEDDNGGLGELSNNIMIYQKRAIPIYYGNFDAGTEYAEYVNRYKSDLGDDVNVYSMVCPTSMSFYWPENSDVSHGSEEDNIANINEHLKGVTPIDLIPILSEHTDEHIYSRTDHHWQPLGAYYSAEEFCKVADVPFANLSTYTKHTIENYVGTLYGYSGSIIIKDNPEDFVYYEPSNEYSTEYFDIDNTPQGEGELLVEATGSSAYLTFMGGDEKITHVTTDVKNGRNLVIIKDSYGNALVPFLTSSFENIYVIDMRYFELNAIDYIKDVNATDLLFAMNTFSATGSNYKQLEIIRTQ